MAWEVTWELLIQDYPYTYIPRKEIIGALRSIYC